MENKNFSEFITTDQDDHAVISRNDSCGFYEDEWDDYCEELNTIDQILSMKLKDSVVTIDLLDTDDEVTKILSVKLVANTDYYEQILEIENSNQTTLEIENNNSEDKCLSNNNKNECLSDNLTK